TLVREGFLSRKLGIKSGVLRATAESFSDQWTPCKHAAQQVGISKIKLQKLVVSKGFRILHAGRGSGGSVKFVEKIALKSLGLTGPETDLSQRQIAST
ncbi:hypothetical protein, partial [Roseateles sp. P5_E11]